MRYEEAMALAQQQLNGGLSHPQPVRQEPIFEEPRLSPETTMLLELAKRYQQQIQEQHLMHQVAVKQLDARFAQMTQNLPPELQAMVVNTEQQSIQSRKANFSSWFGA